MCYNGRTEIENGEWSPMRDFMVGAGIILLYLLPMAGLALAARTFLRIPDELFRKILHFILLGAYIPLIRAFESGWMASALALVLIVIFYPVITLAERWPAFASFLHQRKDGEIKNSMILALSMMAISTLVCWGWLGDRYLVLACIYAWGVGDAFAALVGKRFGKHKIHMKMADPNKSVEGSAAMLAASTISVWMVLLARGGISVGEAFGIALPAAAVSMFVELCTKDGYDTFTCPAAAMLVILPMLRLMGG